MTSLSIHQVTQIRLLEIKSLPNPYSHEPVVYRTIEITHGAEGHEQVTTVSLHALDSKEAHLQVVPPLPAPVTQVAAPVSALPLPEAA